MCKILKSILTHKQKVIKLKTNKKSQRSVLQALYFKDQEKKLCGVSCALHTIVITQRRHLKHVQEKEYKGIMYTNTILCL